MMHETKATPNKQVDDAGKLKWRRVKARPGFMQYRKILIQLFSNKYNL